MRLLVCGGRSYVGEKHLWEVLDALDAEQPVDLLIQGGAPGADALGEWWARSHDIEVREFPAEWEKHGKSAGPRRNVQMLEEGRPHLVIAFPGGSGTTQCLFAAGLRNIPFRKCCPDWSCRGAS